jgi:hypothetical protein
VCLVYIPHLLWASGQGQVPTSAHPFLPSGAPSDHWSILMMGCHVWLMLNPSSLLKLSGCSRISMVHVSPS